MVFIYHHTGSIFEDLSEILCDLPTLSQPQLGDCCGIPVKVYEYTDISHVATLCGIAESVPRIGLAQGIRLSIKLWMGGRDPWRIMSSSLASSLAGAGVYQFSELFHAPVHKQHFLSRTPSFRLIDTHVCCSKHYHAFCTENEESCRC